MTQSQWTLSTPLSTKAVNSKPPETSDTTIPISVIAEEVESRFPNRWFGEFEVGARGPLFWIDDGINRDGCQVVEDGIVCYSATELVKDS